MGKSSKIEKSFSQRSPYEQGAGENPEKTGKQSSCGVSCCTYFLADLLGETALTMINRELMVRGDVAKEIWNLVSFRKSCITRLEKKIAKCRGMKKQLQAEADALYESYALGTV